MDSIKEGNHFCKTFLTIFTGLLKELGLPGSGEADFDGGIEKAFCKSVTLWCTPEPDERYVENLSDQIAYAFGYDAGQMEPVRQAIRDARILAQKSILEVPYRMVSDFAEAAEYMTAFAVDSTRRSVMFGVDSGSMQKHYAVYKMPHSDRIDLFFGIEKDYRPYRLSIGDNMAYKGFFDKETGKLYDLRDPLDMCWFYRPRGEVNHESGKELKKAVKRALQTEIARRVAENVPELPGIPPPEKLTELLRAVESDYSGGVTVPDFAGKVDVSAIYLLPDDPIRFIVESEALIAERVDEFMKRHGPETERLWISHLAAQEILSYTAVLGDAAQKNNIDEGDPEDA